MFFTYYILLYKELNCIEELKINMPKIDFGNCYEKVTSKLDPPTEDKLIIALIEKLNSQSKPTTSYFFYHPETGKKIDAETICKDDEVVVKENVLSQINDTDVNLKDILYLTGQDINIFNLSDDFYNDICYHFESPNGKDIVLKDRVKYFYPNITLCDAGCISKGVNLSTMESICQCKFDLMNNELLENNVFLQNTFGELSDLISSSNIMVLKCYRNVFNKEFIFKGSGGFIIIVIFLLELVFALIFAIKDMTTITKYLYNLTKYFLIYNSNINKNIMHKNINIITEHSKIKEPPKKNIMNSEKLLFNLNSDENYSKRNLNNSKREVKLINHIKPQLRKKSTKNINKPIFEIKQKDIKSPSLSKLNKAKQACGNIDMEEYLKPNLDDMEYDDAIKLDKREFCEFFSEKLKEKQIIMDTFFNKENLTPMSIKIILLLLNIDLYFVINGLFFNEDYISQLYNSNEKETFFSFIPRSYSRFFYATIVSFVVGIIIDCIFIEEKKIKRIFLREKDDPLQLKYEIFTNVKSIRTRYTIFIFLCIFISIFSWYYISCFNNTYPGVKEEWIKSSIAIIIIMQILSFFMVLLQTILRSLSFYYKSEKLYKIKKNIS